MTIPADMPTILPYIEPAPTAGITSDSMPAQARPPRTDVRNLQRFHFPKLPKQIEKPSAGESAVVLWPECEQQVVTAAATAAGAILTQLSDKAHAVIAVTSPVAGDGKTALVLALGPQLAARGGRSVLVIDAHGGQNGLSTRLGIRRNECSRHAIIYPTNLPLLHILPAGEAPMLGMFDAARIARLRDDWPLVLLDLASLAHEEVLPLLHAADGVCLVVRLGVTPRRAAAQSARLIRRAGGKLLGCVVVG